jgi:hypothetical protein
MVTPARRPGRTSEVSETMSGAKHRLKGNRVEREIVDAHLSIGVHAERVPLSGASRYQDNGADVDVYAFGVSECPLVCEVKARKGAGGFRLLDRWLGANDVLFLRANRSDALAVLPWRVYAGLLKEIKKWRPERNAPPLGEIFAERAAADVGGTDNGDPKTEAKNPPHPPRKAKKVLAHGNEGGPANRVAARKARA